MDPTRNVELQPIGVVHSPVVEQRDSGWGEVESRIVLRPELGAGLRGLEQFSHALVVTWLHEARFDSALHLQRRPRDLAHLPPLGIFAQRAKHRPNPIGVSAVRIVRVEPGALVVRGLDAIDGTPVLDLKPYVPQFDRVSDATVPEWMAAIMRDYFDDPPRAG